MTAEREEKPEPVPQRVPAEDIFSDFEARSNIVGLFELLLKIDRRTNPENYQFLCEN
jgi:hypothetical protein